MKTHVLSLAFDCFCIGFNGKLDGFTLVGFVFSLQVVLLLLLSLCWVIVLHADCLFGQRFTAVPKVQKVTYRFVLCPL